MAQAMASMAGLRANSQPVLEGTLQLSGLTRLSLPSGSGRLGVGRSGSFTTIRAHHGQSEGEAASRRAVLGLVAAGLASGSFVQAVLAEAKSIKVGPPPPPSGGLPGTKNSDEARDFDIPLKERFFIQPLEPVAAAKRAKESAQDILNVKSLIDKKAWPYVQNDLRLKAQYLRYDLNTIISSKAKEEKKALKDLTGKLFDIISNVSEFKYTPLYKLNLFLLLKLDHAAKIKSTPEAEKYYAQTVSSLNDVLGKLG
ncbi:hypothetical protein Sjap_003378 [Stephania japonica]|uniref:Uncharacterized protein n=1 Tax=Stephania japonica TaxID=461633 RepID=A0AAP0KQ81_9MAGN